MTTGNRLMTTTSKATFADLVTILGFTPTPQQEAAITAPLEPGMIIAGAGTGKTTVMAARISWLIMSGQVSPDRILGLTFTTKAAGELMSAVRESLPKALKFVETFDNDGHAIELGEPIIATYNSFGSRLLSEHALRLGLEPDSRVMVDATRYQLALRVVCDTAIDFGRFGKSVGTILERMLKLDGSLSDYLIDPSKLIEIEEKRLSMLKEIEVPDKKLIPDMIETSEMRIALAKLVAEFRQSKIDNNVIDYSDQIRLAATAATRSAEMRALVKEQFQVVLLDEYQDTSVSQRVLLQELFGEGHPVMAVGDPCQAIYGWRGAELSNMDNFKNHFQRTTENGFEPATQYSLSANRRSGQNILNAANTLSEELRKIHPNVVELISGIEDMAPGELQVGLLNSFRDELNWICDEIAALNPKEEKGWSNVAVLLRAKKQTAQYVRALEQRGIPVQVIDPGALIDIPEVRDIVCTLEIIADPSANPALARLLAGPRWRIGSRDLALLGRRAAQLAKDDKVETDNFDVTLDNVVADVDPAMRVSLLEALEDLGDISQFRYSPEARERFTALARELRELRAHAGEPVIDIVTRVVRTTGLGIESMIHHSDSGSSRFDHVAAFIDVAGSFMSLEGATTLPAFLAFLRDGERFDNNPEADIVIRDNAVVIMTMHKAKGLEFRYVAMPDIGVGGFESLRNESHWPTAAHLLPVDALPTQVDAGLLSIAVNPAPEVADFDAYKARAKELSRLDDWRLAYVAVTRAKTHLIASASWWGPTQVKPRGPSDFLKILKSHATIEAPWEPEPVEDRNPFLVTEQPLVWPVPLETSAAVQEQAALVTKHMNPNFVVPEIMDELTDEERELIAAWESDIEVLLKQQEEQNATKRIVRLPDSLSASQVIALTNDEEKFTRSLVRPMPRQPSGAADRGTQFHAWVENFYGDRTLMDLDDLEGSGDSDIYSDADLIELKEAFKNGPFANRVPLKNEEPFALVIDGRTWRGRIDAIFQGSKDNANESGRWLVVDWKTGRKGSANEIQLEIYRHAWAQIIGVPADQVDGAFYYVKDQEVSLSSLNYTLTQLGELISDHTEI